MRFLVFVSVGAAALVGWVYLGAMVAAMVPVMDMADLGPGMQILNSFNIFHDLSAEARAALAVLCLPAGAEIFGMPATAHWTAVDFGLVFAMWMMMTLAMMLPSAAPMISAYAETGVTVAPGEPKLSPVFALSLGYLSIWAGYALVATIGQWLLVEARLLSEMMAPATMVLAGTTMLAAGIYQFTPAKRACLMRCQRPLEFFAMRFSNRVPRAYVLGIEQGLLCLGCCWALMTVMFAVGVMNIFWIAVLGAFMAIEKSILSLWPSRLIGILLLAWGGALVAASPAGQALLAG
ncbi:DUF2182 domain-containing protein [Stappia sp. GBMRC 2046]|uniref:DUF2182 domain-containing protein n=2 Tax=Stappia sediminis TaxID=2692190 RepID=A0A7X3LT42_9HYPH|nr:DUF2182 domain-containing protein [Stappia sediminis]